MNPLRILLPLLSAVTALHAAEKPNIIVILTDDHGWADLGAHGVDLQIRTPNLDQLARDGLRFTRGYVTAPQCTPSRAGLISGQYQNKLGVEQNFDPLPGAVLTLPERLKTSGYTTGISGKWHLDSGGRSRCRLSWRERHSTAKPHRACRSGREVHQRQ